MLSRLRTTVVSAASGATYPTQAMLLPVAVTNRVSFVSMRVPTNCSTFGGGGDPARTATIVGFDEPSWPFTSVEIGVMVMTPLRGASAGTLMLACIVVDFTGDA